MHISPLSFASLRVRRDPPRPVVDKLPVVNLTGARSSRSSLICDLRGDAPGVRRYACAAIDHCSSDVRRRRGQAPARFNADCHLDVLVEPVEHRHKAINGEAPPGPATAARLRRPASGEGEGVAWPVGAGAFPAALGSQDRPPPSRPSLRGPEADGAPGQRRASAWRETKNLLTASPIYVLVPFYASPPWRSLCSVPSKPLCGTPPFGTGRRASRMAGRGGRPCAGTASSWARRPEMAPQGIVIIESAPGKRHGRKAFEAARYRDLGHAAPCPRRPSARRGLREAGDIRRKRGGEVFFDLDSS